MPRPFTRALRRLGAALALAASTLPALAALDPAEKTALIDFYNATGGSGWTNRTGWSNPASDPCEDGWYGVLCDATNTHVVALIFEDNHLTGSASLSGLPELIVFFVSSDTGLTTLSLSSLPELQYLVANNSALTTLSLSDLPKLGYLDVSHNALAALSLSDLPELYWLVASHNALTTLNLSDLPKLSLLDVSGNALPALNLSGLPKLVVVLAPFNQIASADLSGLPDELGLLDLRANRLQGAAPTLRAAQAQSMADALANSGSDEFGGALMCPNAITESATPDAQDALWRQATGHNPWDTGCYALPASGSATVAVQANPANSSTAAGVPASVPVGAQGTFTVAAAPGYRLTGLRSATPEVCAGTLDLPPSFFPNPAYTSTAQVAVGGTGACTLVVSAEAVDEGDLVAITVRVSGAGTAQPATSPLRYGPGQPFSYTFTPAPGETLRSASGCGGTLAGNTYTGVARSACTISAAFSSSTVAPVPTLGEWSLMLLGALAAGLGLRRLRRNSL